MKVRLKLRNASINTKAVKRRGILFLFYKNTTNLITKDGKNTGEVAPDKLSLEYLNKDA